MPRLVSVFDNISGVKKPTIHLIRDYLPNFGKRGFILVKNYSISNTYTRNIHKYVVHSILRSAKKLKEFIIDDNCYAVVYFYAQFIYSDRMLFLWVTIISRIFWKTSEI